MKYFLYKILLSFSSIRTVAVTAFLAVSSLLVLTLLNSSDKSTNSAFRSQKTITTDQNKPYTFPFEPLLPGKGVGTFRAIKTEPSYECAFGTDGPILSSPVCPPDKDLTLVILVTSAPGHFLQRKAIRNTWGRRRHVSENLRNTFKGDPQPWRTIFLIGSTNNMSLQTQIQSEARREGDILLGDFLDDYRNLTVKVQQGLCWASHNCNARYILKTDDDCFVNTELFVQFLDKYNRYTSGLYIGSSMKKLDVVRNKLNKWHVSKEAYPYSRYPPYASGTGYLLSRDILQEMVQGASKVQYFPMEDAYTGVLANEIGVQLKDTNRFVLNNVNWSVCNYLYLLVIHQVSPEQQYLGLMYSEEALDPQKCSQDQEYKNWI